MTPAELEQKLEELPSKVYKYNETAIDEREKHELLEADYNALVDELYLKEKATYPNKTVRDLEAFSESQSLSKLHEVIIQKAKWLRAQNLADSAERAFSSAQSQVKLLTAEMKAGIGGN